MTNRTNAFPPAGVMTTIVSSEDELEIIFARVIAVPREAAFRAWIDADQLARWWGPREFTSTCQTDPRPGGAYRIVMHGSDGVEYPLKGIYREFVEPERLVMTVDLSEHPDHWHDAVSPDRDRSKEKPSIDLVKLREKRSSPFTAVSRPWRFGMQ